MLQLSIQHGLQWPGVQGGILLISLSPGYKQFSSTDQGLILGELTKQGIAGAVQEKKVIAGKIYAVRIRGKWHIHKDCTVIQSNRPCVKNCKKPWKEENRLIDMAKPPRW